MRAKIARDVSRAQAHGAERMARARTHQLLVATQERGPYHRAAPRPVPCTGRMRCHGRELTPERGDKPLWVPEQSQSIVHGRHHHVRCCQCAASQSLWSDDGDAERCLAPRVRLRVRPRSSATWNSQRCGPSAMAISSVSTTGTHGIETP
jgi:hypothetical protein